MPSSCGYCCYLWGMEQCWMTVTAGGTLRVVSRAATSKSHKSQGFLYCSSLCDSCGLAFRFSACSGQSAVNKKPFIPVPCWMSCRLRSRGRSFLSFPHQHLPAQAGLRCFVSLPRFPAMCSAVHGATLRHPGVVVRRYGGDRSCSVRWAPSTSPRCHAVQLRASSVVCSSLPHHLRSQQLEGRGKHAHWKHCHWFHHLLLLN